MCVDQILNLYTEGRTHSVSYTNVRYPNGFLIKFIYYFRPLTLKMAGKRTKKSEDKVPSKKSKVEENTDVSNSLRILMIKY